LHCLAPVAALALVGVGLVDSVEVSAQADLACAHLCDDRTDRSVCANMSLALLASSSVPQEPTISNLDDLMDRLLEESRAQTVPNDRSIALYGNQPPKRSGYTGRGGGGSRGGGSGRGWDRQASTSRPKESCNHCGRDWHSDAKCWKKHPEQRPSYMKADNTARKQEAIALIAAFVTNGPSKSQEWILDSGATHHMCHSRKLFESYVPNESSERPIETAGGMVRAEGFGTARLNLITSAGMQKEVILNDVYYLPEASSQPIFVKPD
jgi:hypothetical protein